MINKTILLGISVLLCLTSYAQTTETSYSTKNQPEWVQLMYSDPVNLIQLREAYEAYYQTHSFEKNEHTQFYKRYMKANWKLMDEAGFPNNNSLKWNETEYLAAKKALELSKSPSSQWQEIGPWDYDHEQAMEFEVQSPGSSHVYTIEQAPSNPDVVYAGTATAGVWKTTDKGLNWVLVTQDLLVNSVYAIAINPLNEDEVYFGEENGTIWKSMDGGSNWLPTGSANFQNANKWVRDLKWIGTDSLIAATNAGLYRTIDGGINWYTLGSGEYMEIEIHPALPSTIYTVKLSGNKTQFFKSIDSGDTWTIKDTGWPLPVTGDEQKRVEIGVTNANPNLVYVWASGSVGPDEGLYGVYKSIDAGESFNFVCCGTGPGGTATVDNPNLLGYSGEGTENGGQYYYDLAMGVSPTNENLLFGAGINVWRSEDGGSNWDLNAHWVTWVGDHTKYRYTHADVQDIKFFETASGVDMWVVSDGGIYYSSNQGDTLVPRMHGIHGTDFWGYQAGFKDGYVMLGGTYHNGTLIRYKDIYHGGKDTPNSGGWLAEMGGDNYRGFVNYGNSKIAYADNGAFQFSEVRNERITSLPFEGSKKCNTSYLYGEYGTYGYIPDIHTSFYSPVDDELWLTENNGSSFSEIASFSGGKVIQVKVSWSNPNILYITKRTGTSNYRILRSEDKGISWTDVTPTNANTGNNGARAKYIEIDEEDPNKIWCILMGSQTGNKVFESIDGGLNWTNITTSNINGENVISIFHQYGTEDGLYIGTTRAVYYKNKNMSEWALFNSNLPASTSAVFLEPYYAEGKLRTATQHGVYECEFYENSAPTAMISADKNQINKALNCSLDSVIFKDHSTVQTATASWSWIFEGGIPSTSNEENPIVYYENEGTFDVQLIVTDQYGTDTIIKTDFIQVSTQFIGQHVQEDFESGIFPPHGWSAIEIGSGSWEQATQINGTEENGCAQFPNYWEDATGTEHILLLPAMNFEDAIQPSISFDYTYNNNGSYEDSLALIYRIEAGPWQTLWQKGGSELSVSGTDVWFWYDANPTVYWVNESIDLNNFIGTSCIEFAFKNIGTYGNHIWLDNVNLDANYTGLNHLENTLLTKVHPNPSSGIINMNWKSGNTPTVIKVLTVNGALIQTLNLDKGIHQTQLNLNELADGFYFVVVEQGERKEMIKISVNH
jgi:PKD repeat protein